MTDRQTLGYALLALLILVAVGGLVWSRITHRRKIARRYRHHD